VCQKEVIGRGYTENGVSEACLQLESKEYVTRLARAIRKTKKSNK